MNHTIYDAIANHPLFFILIQSFLHTQFTRSLPDVSFKNGTRFLQFTSAVSSDSLPSICFLLLQVILHDHARVSSSVSSKILGRPSQQHLLGLRSLNVIFSGLHIKVPGVPGEVYDYGLFSVLQQHVYPLTDTMC